MSSSSEAKGLPFGEELLEEGNFETSSIFLFPKGRSFASLEEDVFIIKESDGTYFLETFFFGASCDTSTGNFPERMKFKVVAVMPFSGLLKAVTMVL